MNRTSIEFSFFLALSTEVRLNELIEFLSVDWLRLLRLIFPVIWSGPISLHSQNAISENILSILVYIKIPFPPICSDYQIIVIIFKTVSVILISLCVGETLSPFKEIIT